ncbi:MAG: TolC family protein [Saprospiraceae bacterium]|nr:TolC family protein [Saprospiraceae bacterium]
MKTMDMIVRSMTAACLMYFFTMTAGAQQILSMKDCLQKVRSSAAESEQIDLELQSADLRKKVLSRNYWPQTSLSGKATWQSEVTSLPIELPNFDIPTVSQDQYAMNLDFNQLIYDGGMTKALFEIRDLESELKIDQLEVGLVSTDKHAIDLFFQISLQKQLLVNANLLLDQLDQSLSRSEKLLSGGIIDKKDALAIKVKVIETSQKAKEASYYLLTAKESLAKLMNIEGTDFDISDSSISTPTDNQQFVKRPELKSLEAKERLILAQNHLNEAKVKPSMAAFVNTGYGRPGLNFLANKFDFYTMAGVRLSVPLDHLYTRKKEMENQINTLAAEDTRLTRENVALNFSIAEKRLLGELEKLEAWLMEDDQIIDMRQQILTVSKSKWEGGVITTTEYLAEVTELALAEERRATHSILLEYQNNLLANLYGISIPN